MPLHPFCASRGRPDVVAGRINKQIAGDLGIVEKTVKVHRQRVMEKLGVRNLVDLVRMADKLNV
jgi:FixJ family two-component response regulator